MAIDQYGETYHDLGKHPRAELLRRLDCQHADKMYHDTVNGTVKHIGYVIGGRWCAIYRVDDWTPS
jgi:hypothetical protein